MTHLSTLVCYEESRQHIPTLSVRVKVTPPLRNREGEEKRQMVMCWAAKGLEKKVSGGICWCRRRILVAKQVTAIWGWG